MSVIVQFLGLALGFGLLERMPWLRFRRERFFRAAFVTDLLHFTTTAGLASLGVAFVALGSGTLGALGVPRLAALPLPGFASVAIALVLLDFGQILAHRALHRFGPLWELHKVHHSSPSLDWLATFRAHALEHAFRNIVAPLPIVLLGLPVGAFAAAATILAIYAVTNHSNLALPLRWLEPLLVTPRLHRLHHVPATSERNFGAVFTLWDRWMGTLVLGPDATPATLLGVPGEETTYPQRWPEHVIEPLRRWLGRAPARQVSGPLQFSCGNKNVGETPV
jgi:lathosterol oxidase